GRETKRTPQHPPFNASISADFSKDVSSPFKCHNLPPKPSGAHAELAGKVLTFLNQQNESNYEVSLWQQGVDGARSKLVSDRQRLCDPSRVWGILSLEK
ncbi:Hypothetical predicted protein, partial [Podarcis lilfordi]